MYGRGRSAAPNTIYGADLFVSQLSNLLFHLNISEPFELVGLSMGGAIASSFSLHFPERVHRLCLVAPAGLPLDLAWPARIPTWPAVNKLMLSPSISRFIMKRQQQKDLSVLTVEDPEAAQLLEELINLIDVQIDHNPDYLRALLATLKDFPLEGLNETIHKVGRHATRDVLLVWGDADQTVPYGNAKLMLEAMPRSKLVTIPKGTHMAVVSHANFVNEHVLKFLAAPTQ